MAPRQKNERRTQSNPRLALLAPPPSAILSSHSTVPLIAGHPPPSKPTNTLRFQASHSHSRFLFSPLLLVCRLSRALSPIAVMSLRHVAILGVAFAFVAAALCASAVNFRISSKDSLSSLAGFCSGYAQATFPITHFDEPVSLKLRSGNPSPAKGSVCDPFALPAAPAACRRATWCSTRPGRAPPTARMAQASAP